jgi:hypothetical protein
MFQNQAFLDMISAMFALGAAAGCWKLEDYDGSRPSFDSMVKKMGGFGLVKNYFSVLPLVPQFVTNHQDFQSNGLIIALSNSATRNQYGHTLQRAPSYGLYSDQSFSTPKETAIRYLAITTNQVQHIWYPKFGTHAADISGHVQLYELTDTHSVSDCTLYRIGWATASGLEALKSHPFNYVGDVPGTFGISYRESGCFSQGQYIPFTYRLRGEPISMAAYGAANSPLNVAYCPHNRTIHAWGGVQLLASSGSLEQTALSLALPPADTLNGEELIPVISLACPTSFKFRRIEESPIVYDPSILAKWSIQ